MNICVLQPSYHGSTLDYRPYNSPGELSQLWPEDTFHYEFLNKVSTFQQIRKLKKKAFDIYVNLCDGDLDSEIPSIDVIRSLQYFNLPYTGPGALLYDPPRNIMKMVACSADVAVPAYIVAENIDDISFALKKLRFPLLIKPCLPTRKILGSLHREDNSTTDITGTLPVGKIFPKNYTLGDSTGIESNALVKTAEDLRQKAMRLIDEYDKIIIEEYIEGRELPVLVCAEPDILSPPTAIIPCYEPAQMAENLKKAACKVFKAFSGEGYALMDFKVSKGNKIFFLEMNSPCSVFKPEGHYGKADYILRHNELGHRGFLKKIITEGLTRHARKQKPYTVRPADYGYGIFSTRKITLGEIIYKGEESPHRIVTLSHVEKTWSKEDKDVFYRYAYPAGKDIYILWDIDPAGWAPQNHSCAPNTTFFGLNVVAIREIEAGEELTIDYSTFCDERMTEFDCKCGSPSCRGKMALHGHDHQIVVNQ